MIGTERKKTVGALNALCSVEFVNGGGICVHNWFNPVRDFVSNGVNAPFCSLLFKKNK